MLVVGGRRLYGKVEQVGSTYIATTFAFLQFLPLFPVQSHIVVAEGFVVKHGRTLTIARGEVHAEHGGQRVLCALMQQTLMTMHGKADAPADRPLPPRARP